MMEQFSLEDDDMGIFITQTSKDDEDVSNLLEESFEINCNEVVKMDYLDISEDECSKQDSVFETGGAVLE